MASGCDLDVGECTSNERSQWSGPGEGRSCFRCTHLQNHCHAYSRAEDIIGKVQYELGYLVPGQEDGQLVAEVVTVVGEQVVPPGTARKETRLMRKGEDGNKTYAKEDDPSE